MFLFLKAANVIVQKLLARTCESQEYQDQGELF